MAARKVLLPLLGGRIGTKSGSLLAAGLSQAGAYYLGQFPIAYSEGYAEDGPNF